MDPAARERDIVVGIDAGGTMSRAVAVDSSGQTVASAQAGPANPRNVGIDSAAEELAQAIRGLVDPQRIRALAAGVAGLSDEALADELREALLRRLPTLRTARLRLTHDLEIAWRGAFAGAAGICLIAGTGSACYARRADGASRRVSGRSDERDDPGSGYGIAAAAIAMGALRLPEGTDPNQRSAVAALAPQLMAAAERGDPAAKRVLAEQTQALAGMVAESRRLFAPEESVALALFGGTLANRAYRAALAKALGQLQPGVQIVEPLADALRGAVALANDA